VKITKKEFSNELLKKIKNRENELNELAGKLSKKYKVAFANKNRRFNAKYEKEGLSHFQTGYHSYLSIEILDENGKILYELKKDIWKCSKAILGLSFYGEFLEVPIERIKTDAIDFIEEILKKY
jgi:hypothetical protein